MVHFVNEELLKQTKGNFITVSGIIIEVMRYLDGVMLSVSSKRKIFIKESQIPLLFNLSEDIVSNIKLEAMTYLAGYFIKATGLVENWYGGSKLKFKIYHKAI